MNLLNELDMSSDIELENAQLRQELEEAIATIIALRAKIEAPPVVANAVVHIYQAALAAAEERLGVPAFRSSSRRSRSQVAARRIGCLVLRARAPWLSWKETAMVTGFEYSTIRHGIRKLQTQLESDPELAAFVDGLVRGKAEAAE